MNRQQPAIDCHRSGFIVITNDGVVSDNKGYNGKQRKVTSSCMWIALSQVITIGDLVTGSAPTALDLRDQFVFPLVSIQFEVTGKNGENDHDDFLQNFCDFYFVEIHIYTVNYTGSNSSESFGSAWIGNPACIFKPQPVEVGYKRRFAIAHYGGHYELITSKTPTTPYHHVNLKENPEFHLKRYNYISDNDDSTHSQGQEKFNPSAHGSSQHPVLKPFYHPAQQPVLKPFQHSNPVTVQKTVQKTLHQQPSEKFPQKFSRQTSQNSSHKSSPKPAIHVPNSQNSSENRPNKTVNFFLNPDPSRFDITGKTVRVLHAISESPEISESSIHVAPSESSVPSVPSVSKPSISRPSASKSKVSDPSAVFEHYDLESFNVKSPESSLDLIKEEHELRDLLKRLRLEVNDVRDKIVKLVSETDQRDLTTAEMFQLSLQQNKNHTITALIKQIEQEAKRLEELRRDRDRD